MTTTGKIQGKIGLVVYTFSRRDHGSISQCNIWLARAAERAIEQYGRDNLFIVAQEDVAKWLVSREVDVDYCVYEPKIGPGLQSQDVWKEARQQFRSRGIKRVISIEHPFLQWRKTHPYVTRGGFELVPFSVPNIGFDKRSKQWQCRGRLRLLTYAVRQMIGNQLNGALEFFAVDPSAHR